MISSPPQRKGAQVGKSGITPCKHFLLNRLLGREMGVLSRGMPPVSEVLLYDLTAGDAVPYIPAEQSELLPQAAFRDGCSPGIFLRHADWLVQRNRLPVQLTGCEKQPIQSCLRTLVAGWQPMTGRKCPEVCMPRATERCATYTPTPKTCSRH